MARTENIRRLEGKMFVDAYGRSYTGLGHSIERMESFVQWTHRMKAANMRHSDAGAAYNELWHQRKSQTPEGVEAWAALLAANNNRIAIQNEGFREQFFDLANA